MRKCPDESYKEYAIRWKGVASQVQLPLTHKEINSLFVDTLPSLYHDKLVGKAFPKFEDLMYSVERIEEGIKSEKIKDMESRTEGHIRATVAGRNGKRKLNPMEKDYISPYFCFPTPYYVFQQPPDVMHQGQHFSQQTSITLKYDRSLHHSKKRKRTKTYHSIPIPYSKLVPLLVKNNMISVIHTKPRKPPYPKWYDPNAICEYHDRARGHSRKDCVPLKNKVQALIDEDPAKFKKLMDGYEG